jgi:hypothetical protein
MVKIQMTNRRKIIIAALIIVALASGGFLLWAETPFGPMPEALAALQSDSKVQVTSDRWLVFQPNGTQKQVGFIFYPGGRVDERSYAPMARALAEEGYLSIIVPMPLNLAVFGVPPSAVLGDWRPLARRFNGIFIRTQPPIADKGPCPLRFVSCIERQFVITEYLCLICLWF